MGGSMKLLKHQAGVKQQFTIGVIGCVKLDHLNVDQVVDQLSAQHQRKMLHYWSM
jgi:hypothetical protein